MGLQQAAIRLDATLRKFPWYLSVGIGRAEDEDVLYVYVKSLRHAELTQLSKGWEGHRVLVRPTGAVRATKTTFGAQANVP